jgi:hypothetical protein
MPEWEKVFRPGCHRSYRTDGPLQSVGAHVMNRHLYTGIFDGWIDESSEYLDDTKRATWITTQTPILHRVVAAYGQMGPSMFAATPPLYQAFTTSLYRLRSRMSMVQRAIQARVAVQEPFSPLVVLQIEWASLCPGGPVAVGDLLVGVLAVSSFTDHQMVKCNRFGSFFAALFVYLELSRLLGQAWKIHEAMERARHTRWVGDVGCIDDFALGGKPHLRII